MMKKLLGFTLAALMLAGCACAEIATVETTIPLTQPDSPVTITLTEYGGLKPGMNVSATILCETAENVLCVPVAAVARGDTVQAVPEAALSEDGASLADPALLEERAVTLGRSDAAYIEITSGLEEGEAVAFSDPALTGTEG